MKQLGLIGYPLSHSFSPAYFTNKFKQLDVRNWEYNAYPLSDIKDFPQLWRDKPNLVGLNVTIPYKVEIIPFLDELDETAQVIGAVNTIKKINDKLIGFNTDTYGFESALLQLLDGATVQKALILGTGGAAKAVEYVLKKNHIVYQFVSRNAKGNRLTYDDLNKDILKQNQLIINTTPLGTYPNVDYCPKLNYNCITEKHFFLDLVYNPAKTLFLENGEKQGAKVLNGLVMLHQQAEKAWRIWTEDDLTKG